VVRVVTTGGGGWGDPLAREGELVLRDVIEGKVTRAAARAEYGVVVAGDGDDATLDQAATDQLRAEMKVQRTAPPPMIHRGEGYEQMLRGECAPRMRA